MRSASPWWPPGRNQVAVVIPTHDNIGMLPPILDALSAQSGMAGMLWHVVVVDNGSREGVPLSVRARQFPFRLTVIKQRHTGEAWARNEGWKRAEAPVVLFLDDDQVPGDRLLVEHLKAHAAHPRAVVLGRISLAGASRRQSWTEYDGAKLAAKCAALADGEKPSGLHAGGNFSLPVDLLERAGGFDHRLPGSDHVDLGFRLNQMGALFLYQPRAHVVRHSHVDYAKWQLRHGLQGRLDVALFRDRGYGGGLLSMVACFHDRNPMNRAVIRLALSSAMAERGLVGLAGTLGDLALRFGLRRISLASMSVAANVLYWRGVRDGVRGNARFWQLVRVTRRRAGRTYERVRGATT